jgi:hypothetical protein
MWTRKKTPSGKMPVNWCSFRNMKVVLNLIAIRRSPLYFRFRLGLILSGTAAFIKLLILAIVSMI